jgi:cytochrome c556
MRLALAALTALVPLATSVAADPLDDAIKARRAYFTLLGANMGGLAAMAKGETDYSAEAAETFAANLAAMTSYRFDAHFPQGSDNAAKSGDTRATPAIWENMSGFSERNEGLATAVMALQDKAGAGRAELGQAVGQVGAACKACHDDYRAKDF